MGITSNWGIIEKIVGSDQSLQETVGLLNKTMNLQYKKLTEITTQSTDAGKNGVLSTQTEPQTILRDFLINSRDLMFGIFISM